MDIKDIKKYYERKYSELRREYLIRVQTIDDEYNIQLNKLHLKKVKNLEKLTLNFNEALNYLKNEECSELLKGKTGK